MHELTFDQITQLRSFVQHDITYGKQIAEAYGEHGTRSQSRRVVIAASRLQPYRRDQQIGSTAVVFDCLNDDGIDLQRADTTPHVNSWWLVTTMVLLL